MIWKIDYEWLLDKGGAVMICFKLKSQIPLDETEEELQLK
jgi:hypothetical protein